MVYSRGLTGFVSVYELLLILAACFFAISMGYHYAGAIVGPAYGGGAIPLRLGLLVSAFLVVVGSMVTPVVRTYVELAQLDDRGYFSSLLASAIATTIATYAKVPTSTIQIFAFSLIGSAITSSKRIEGSLLLYLVISWISAPLLAYLLAPILRRAVPGRASGRILLLTMCYSALVLGLNDVSNVASPTIGAGLDERLSRLISGALMGFGLVIWGVEAR